MLLILVSMVESRPKGRYFIVVVVFRHLYIFRILFWLS